MDRIKNTTIILLTVCLLLSGCSKKTPATAKAESNRSQETVNLSSQHQTSGLTSTSQRNDTTPQHALPSINAGNPNRVVIANGEWNPYFSENLRYYGVVSRIVKEAFESEGIEVEYVFRPWKRGMEDAKKAFNSFVTTGEVYDAEQQLKKKDGSKIDVSLNLSSV